MLSGWVVSKDILSIRSSMFMRYVCVWCIRAVLRWCDVRCTRRTYPPIAERSVGWVCVYLCTDAVITHIHTNLSGWALSSAYISSKYIITYIFWEYVSLSSLKKGSIFREIFENNGLKLINTAGPKIFFIWK